MKYVLLLIVLLAGCTYPIYECENFTIGTPILGGGMSEHSYMTCKPIDEIVTDPEHKPFPAWCKVKIYRKETEELK